MLMPNKNPKELKLQIQAHLISQLLTEAVNNSPSETSIITPIYGRCIIYNSQYLHNIAFTQICNHEVVGKHFSEGFATNLSRRARSDVPEEHFERLPKYYRYSATGTILLESNQEAAVPSLLEKPITDMISTRNNQAQN